jgi:large subunit ribosomal protein L35
MKTHKATAKRFWATGTGKLMRLKGNRSHLRRKKPKRVRRVYDRAVELEAGGERARVKRLAPYLD